MERKPVPSRAPEKFENLRIKPAESKAAGSTAVTKAVKIVNEQAGVFRGGRALFRLNQKGGVDCPGCAWPDPDDDRSVLGEYCENGAKAIAEEATQKAIGAEFFGQHSIQELSQLSDFELGQLGRITAPMVLEPGSNHYQPIDWDDAFNLVGQHLNSLKSPDEAIFYTSGRTSNEAAFLYQLFVRMYGTNNLPDCSNMCHESSGVALSETLGIGKGSVKLEDFYETDLIFILGQNPGTNHPRMLTALERAKKNGAKIITANPLQEAGLISFSNPQKVSGLLGGATVLTDLYLQVKVNGDIALLKAIMYQLWQKEEADPGSVFDVDFISNQTEGFEDFHEDLSRQNFAELCEACGIPQQRIIEAAELISTRKKMIICWAMGLTQHKNAVDTIKEAVNLLLLRGSIGKPGAGSCPVRGHSNVQGDRTMGIWEKPPEQFLTRLESEFDFEAPRKHGIGHQSHVSGKGQGFYWIGWEFSFGYS